MEEALPTLICLLHGWTLFVGYAGLFSWNGGYGVGGSSSRPAWTEANDQACRGIATVAQDI